MFLHKLVLSPRKRRRPWRRLKGSFKGPFKVGDRDGQIMMDVLQSYNAQDDDGGAAPQLRWGAIHADAPLVLEIRIPDGEKKLQPN